MLASFLSLVPRPPAAAYCYWPVPTPSLICDVAGWLVQWEGRVSAKTVKVSKAYGIRVIYIYLYGRQLRRNAQICFLWFFFVSLCL